MMNLKRFVSVCALFAGAALLPAFAETYWSAKNNDSKTRATPFTDPSYWKDANGTVATSTNIFSDANDFKVAYGRQMRHAAFSLTAKSYSIGDLNLASGSQVGYYMHDSSSPSFSTLPEGVTFAAGGWRMNTYTKGHETRATLWSLNVYGDISVISPASAPFELQSYQYNYRRDVFNGRISGDATVALKIMPYGNGNGYRCNESFGFRNLTNYFGAIEVESISDSAAADGNGSFIVGMEFGTTTFPGTLQLNGRGAAFGFVDGTNQASVANLKLGAKSHVVLKMGAVTNGCLTVTNAYEQSGVVIVEPWIPAPFSAGRFPFLRLPSSASVNKDDFVVSNVFLSTSLQKVAELHPDFFAGTVSVDTDELTGEKVVSLVMTTGAAQLTAADNTNYTKKKSEGMYASSMTNATHWTDGEVDHTNAVALTNGNNLRTTYEACTFPGRHLVLDGSSAGLNLCTPTFNIDYLYLLATTVTFRVTNGTKDLTINGQQVYIADDTTMNLYSYTGSPLKFDAEMIGGGLIKTHGRGAGTDSYAYYLEFGALNTNWQGTVFLQTDIYYNTTKKNYFPNFTQGEPQMYLSDGRNLGGALTNFTYDALRLSSYAKIILRDDVTLSAGLNRGVCIDGAAQNESSYDFTINQPVTFGGSFYKTGTSTLTLGDKAQFLTYTPTTPESTVTNIWQQYDFKGLNLTQREYESVAVTETPDPNYPDLSFLAISNGALKVTHVDAVNGVTVDFTPAAKKTTALKLDFSPADADLRLYGVRNVKTATPFVGTVNVTFDTINTPTENVFTNGIFTVKTSVYETTREQFNVTAPKVRGYHVTPVTFETGDATTFGYECRKRGLMVIFH